MKMIEATKDFLLKFEKIVQGQDGYWYRITIASVSVDFAKSEEISIQYQEQRLDDRLLMIGLLGRL